jgi:Fungal N-terminal domain of STAND proteins
MSMEALGSVSSVIAVVQIAGSVAKLCGGYIADVKDARQDIERLQQKAATLCDVLQRLTEENDRTNSKLRKLSDNVLKSVDQCLQDLGKLQEKIQPKTRHKTMSRVGLRALKWPLSKSSVNEEVRMIEGYLAVFDAALQLDHMYVSITPRVFIRMAETWFLALFPKVSTSNQSRSR